MSKLRHLCALPITALCAVLLPTTLRAQAAPDTSYFVWQAGRDAGAAVVRPPHSGEYVYAVAHVSDGRLAQRFVIGTSTRSEFDLFSADEEAALWTLRDRQRFPQAYLPPRPARDTSAQTPSPRLALDWPKVVVADGRTCVPNSDFATAADWRSHLVCWDRATREIRHD